ncbi:MAG: TonB-dependent siderophore receptor [Massilia sp.]
MSPTPFQYSLVCCAIAQAFCLNAAAQSTQSLPEVVVSASRTPLADRASVGGFNDAPLQDTPASISTFDRARMQDLGIGTSTDAMKYDASVSDAYNAVGYAEQFSIRGFALDNAASYRKDGIAISGDTQIPLENKERIEVLKGLSGLQAGLATPGGIVNYVTKRPTNKPLLSATLGLSERGTVYGAVDAGGRFADPAFGYRFNAAAERLRSYVKGANGERQFVSAAFDWQISPDALLQVDMDTQHKSQLTAPGYQLIRNETLPIGVSASTLLNDQPWARPVDTRSSNLGARFAYRINADWHATVSANAHWFKRDDFTAFPYGCGSEGLDPGYCSNGDYDVYDYQSEGESKSPRGAQALLQGKLAGAGLIHELTFGAGYASRRDKYGDYVYDPAGTSNIYHNIVVPPAINNPHTGPVLEHLRETERSVFAQDIVTLSPALTLHAGLRHEQVKRNQDGVVSDDGFTLPSAALLYHVNGDWTAYGSYSHGLELGGIAPFGTVNNNQSLSPSRARQIEFGVKGALGEDLSLTASLFQIRKGLEYIDQANYYVRNGTATHRGLELSAQGHASRALALSLSLMALNTRQDGTGQADHDGKRVTDVPAFKSTAWAEYSLAEVPGLKVNAGWQYAGKKAFDAANTVFVPGYHLFDLGAAYALRVGGVNATLRARVDNVFDKFFWRDVTPALGGYLIPGAPRTFRLTAQFDL